MSRGLAVFLAALACLPLAAAPARAFSFFGLFGSDVPEPSATALPYEVTFESNGGDVESAMQQASSLYQLRKDAPPDGSVLVSRAQADFGPIIDAIWSQGYYNTRVTIFIGSEPLQIGQDREGLAARAAEAYRGRARVPIRVIADTGPLFRFGTVSVVNTFTGLPFPPEVLPPYIVKIGPGDPAVSSAILTSVARITDWFRAESFPLTKVEPPAPLVNHATLTVDVTLRVTTGPRAGIGEVFVKGPKTFPQEVVRSFIYLDYGQPYSPKALEDTRKSVATIPAVGSARIREGTELDRNGNLPVFVDVTDRAPNLVGFSAGYSTIDGPQTRAFYENRNVFGEAERFRIEGSTFFVPRNDGSRIKDPGDLKLSDIGQRVTMSFLKPALGGTRFDYTLDAIAERNRIGSPRFGGYTDRLAGVVSGFRYRVDEELSFTAGLKYERGQTSDVISKVDYQLVGTPVSVRFDNTDNLLNPTKGVRIFGTVAPYPSFLGSSVSLTRATVQASTYFAFDQAGDYVLAGRVGAGSLLDAPGNLALIPSNYRFYTGGSDSIRGYRYQTVAPRGPFGFVVGGRSEFDASLEARVKVTDSIGVVPFFDMGAAYADTTPDFRTRPQYSAGIGLRYYTGIGPIRLDVAFPLNPRPGDQPVVLYVSIGQAF